MNPVPTFTNRVEHVQHEQRLEPVSQLCGGDANGLPWSWESGQVHGNSLVNAPAVRPRRGCSRGVSSMKLHRDLGISQTSAWFLGHRIRQAMLGDDPLFAGPVEADETYVGGREFNKHETSQADCWSGPQPAGDEYRLAPWFRPAARECLNTIVRPRATEPDGDANIVLLRWSRASYVSILSGI